MNITIDTDALLKQLLYDPQNPLLFNNGFFVFFFTVFIAVFYALRHKIRARNYFFGFCSLYFFYKASGFFVGLVIASAIVDFVLSNAIYRQQNKNTKKGLLLLSIVFNLGLLFYFKYTNFFVAVSNDLFQTGFNPLNILLPVGISFYTFENLSYTIDVYRGEFKPAKKFSEYLLFLAFFPKLVMGPIVRAHDFIPQVSKPYSITENDFAKGFYLIISGLFKKLIISDYLTLNFVDFIFDDPSRYTGLENLFAVYAYAAVIYCDFSGYSDVAIGIAKWLGFTIPPNFLSPYQSKNITEFWRRWHMSLSSWLRDYLYIPLGGNKKGTIAGYLFALLFFAGIFAASRHLLVLDLMTSSILTATVIFIYVLPAIVNRSIAGLNTNVNLLTTMLLGGFWHGASWNFIIWGALHGTALAIHKIWIMFTGQKASWKDNTAFNIIAGVITFHFVCFCWIFFKAADYPQAVAMIKQIVNDFGFDVWGKFFENYKAVVGMIALALVLHLFPDGLANKVISKFKKVPMVAYIIVFFAFLLTYGFFKSAEQVMPIYLRF